MARKAGYTVKNNVLSTDQRKRSESRIKLRIYAKLFHQRGGAFDYAMRAGPVSANHTAMLSVSARTISLRCFLACPRSTFLLSTVRTDQNLFDLIPAGSGFLTVAKSHPIFSQYWENNYSSDQEICYEFFLSSRFSLSPLLLTRR
jgi:hypothetical protein